jgi:hypothetical protein
MDEEVMRVVMQKREWKDLSEEEKSMIRMGFVVVAVSFTLAMIDFYLLQFFLQNSLGLADMSWFARSRTVFAFFVGTIILPLAVLVEFATSHVKKRSVKPKNILIFLSLGGEALLVGLVLLTLFDVLFSGASIYLQVPLMILGVSLPNLIMALTAARLKPIRDYFKGDRIAH